VEGGDWLKFSDVVIATASLVLTGFLLDFVLKGVFVLLNSTMSEMLAWIIAFLVTSLIIGYVFALKIQDESRIRTIGSIVVLSTFTLMLFLLVWIANPIASPWVKDSLENLFNTIGWTNYDWSAYLALAVTLEVVLALVLSFIGLYAGSMLRKPKKT
jgi:hypothetical protein